MKSSLHMVSAAFLLTLLSSPAIQARSLSVDDNITCSDVAPAKGTLSVNFSGTGAGNKGSSGFNLPVLICESSLGNPPDTNLTPLAYIKSKTKLYTSIDLSVAGGTPSDYVGHGLALSSFASQSVAIVAMVNVFTLTAHHAGDTEIMINYQSFPESACDNVLKPIAPSFVWFNTTYTFVGGGGVVTPCDANSTNDFLFGPNGALLGYNSAPDFSGQFTLTPGLPPGWKAVVQAAPVK